VIFDMAVWVADTLHTRKFPVEVRYGREPVSSKGYGSHVIQITRDDESGDQLPDTPRSVSRLPDYRATRGLGVVVHLFVSCGITGAMMHEHERECDLIVDGLITALLDWAQEGRSQISWAHSGYVPPSVVDGTEHRAAVVYQMRFAARRGVYRRDYDGTIPATAILSGMGIETHVLLPDDEHEVVPWIHPRMSKHDRVCRHLANGLSTSQAILALSFN
jgi:hypothetical protein